MLESKLSLHTMSNYIYIYIYIKFVAESRLNILVKLYTGLWVLHRLINMLTCIKRNNHEKNSSNLRFHQEF